MKKKNEIKEYNEQHNVETAIKDVTKYRKGINKEDKKIKNTVLCLNFLKFRSFCLF